MILPNYGYGQPMGQPMYQGQQYPQNAFVVVRSEEEARNYPVAVGNSITFRNENEPYCYTKTMGFSQLDRPVFEKYRMVKEEPAEISTKPAGDYSDIKKDVDMLKKQMAEIRGELYGHSDDKPTDAVNE